MQIKKPDNSWFTGRHYEYNADQDQNRKEIKREIAASTFVDDTDYDSDGYKNIFTNVRYKQYIDRSVRGEYSQNARNWKRNKQIEIVEEIVEIKENDRFRTMDQAEDETPFKVTDIDRNRNTSKTKATLINPGLYQEYNSNTILSLE